MIYLLDTCCISDFVKCDPGTTQRLKSTAPSDIAIASITVMELEYGLLHNPDRAKKIRSAIQALIASVTILPYTEKEAIYSAKARAALRKAGNPIGDYDILISGVALSHQLILVTANEKEFQRISELQIENWRQR